VLPAEAFFLAPFDHIHADAAALGYAPRLLPHLMLPEPPVYLSAGARHMARREASAAATAEAALSGPLGIVDGSVAAVNGTSQMWSRMVGPGVVAVDVADVDGGMAVPVTPFAGYVCVDIVALSLFASVKAELDLH
jgi:hypothetical protein